MKIAAGVGIATIALLVAAAHAGGEPAAAPAPARAPAADWGEWTRPLQPHIERAPPAQAAEPAPAPAAAAAEIDVVDAHWMALTMWGEARNGGEAAMRAVGHVIENRHRAGTHGTYVTEAVSEAWQFSCWNRGDPNYAAIMNIDSLAPDSEDRRMWVTAKRVAEEILSGRSADPTGGALFYHTAAVAPRWSAGVAPVARIGGHLFFRTAA